MSLKVSRRALARYATDELLSGSSAQNVAEHLAAVLITSAREKEAGLLLDDISYELQSRGHLASATVTSAYQLSTGLRNEITSLVKNLAKVRQVILDEQVDKSVIGGVRIQTADRIWDKTVTAQLSRLKEVT